MNSCEISDTRLPFTLSRAVLESGDPKSESCVYGVNQADELVQDVMLKVWQKADGFNAGKAAASTWIYTIARNCRTDLYRRLQKFDTPLSSEDVSNTEDSEKAFIVLHKKRSGDRIRKLDAPLKFTDWKFRWMNPFLKLHTA